MEAIAEDTKNGKQRWPVFSRVPPPHARDLKRDVELFQGFVSTPAGDQLRLVEQALAQLRESVVITTAELEEPGPFIVYVNPAFTRMTGWKPEELVGRNPRILQGPKTTRKTLDRLRAQLKKGEAFEGEDINYRQDGSEFHIDWYIEPLRDPSGKITYWVAVQRDVTERSELQAQLLRAQRLEGIGLLASGIAHDLNNVLAPVLMGCAFLREYIVDEDARNFLGVLEKSTKRGAGLVKQILSFARGLSGTAALIDPRHIMGEIATMARATFPKSIEVIEDAPVGVGMVEVDATQLHQVLLNLCINARDAIAETGKITMRARRVELSDPLKTLRDEIAMGTYVVLSVSDTGSGMLPETARKIFDPFFSTKAPGKGTGLGLSTVATIVKHQQGVIDLQTAPGMGTTFSVYLPAAMEDSAGSAETNGDLLVNSGAGRSILIADDELAIAEIMKETVEAAGYKATLAANGLEALVRATQVKPEIALIDIMMPGASGTETIRELRLRFPGLRVIAMSGLSEEETREAALEANAVLQKPFSVRQLMSALQG